MKLLISFSIIVCIITFPSISFGQTHDKEDSLLYEKANRFVQYYYSNNKLDSALLFAEFSLDLAQKTFGENHLFYASSANNIALLYEEIGNYRNAEFYYLKSAFIRKKILGENHLEYAKSLSKVANIFELQSKYIEAENAYLNILSIKRNKLGILNIDYATSLNNLAFLYQTIGKYTEAEKLYIESLSIKKKILGEKNASYATGLSNLAGVYESVANYSKAEQLYLLSLNVRKKVLGENHEDYASSLNNLGYLYTNIYRYNLAFDFYTNALKVRERVLGINHPDYANSVNNLAYLNLALKNYSTADSLYQIALSIRKKIFGSVHQYVANSLNNLAHLYLTVGNLSKAESLFKEALNLFDVTVGQSHPDYATTLNNLAIVYQKNEKWNLAENAYKQTLDIRVNSLGISHPEYANSLYNLTNLYFAKNDRINWLKYIDNNLFLENKNQQLFLKGFSETEKENILNNSGLTNDKFISMAYHFKSTNTNKFYQYTSSQQGWLLKGKVQLISQANLSNKEMVKNLLVSWQNTNSQYNSAIQLTTEKRKLNNINVDSLQEQSLQLEKQLIAAMPGLQAVITNTGFTGKDVAAKLKPKEAVVHWVSFQYKSPKQWTDSVLYAAYIITANDTAPKFVTVFEEKQLQQILKSYHGGSGRSTIKKENSNNSITDVDLYNLIWKPLLPYLQNATTIYNLPAGLLHKISFAALTDSSNKSLIDSYEIHQLLSINELVNPLKVTNNNNTIALFGGANYDAVNTANTTSNTIAQAPMYRNATNNKYIHFNYLQGTKTEVETVATNAKNTNWKTQSYIGTTATEDNFKNISGENAPKILHIATHGFYFPPTKTKPSNFINDDKNTPRDFPLLRSGLVLSGVNNYWGKDTVLENKEDGIVTAQEISNLNLLNTDLVVLSACQTALGDINGSEGVYGLQRAFKMAGVKKLLMSLWEVPDAETAELMQLFYSNVFKGDTYYTAFRKAQLALKAKYKDPTKWAGFVLVGE